MDRKTVVLFDTAISQKGGGNIDGKETENSSVLPTQMLCTAGPVSATECATKLLF